MDYVEFQLRVQDDAKVLATRQGGGQASGKFRLTPLHQNLINVLDSWVREQKITRRAEMEALGSLLYECLFDVDVDHLFRRSLDEVERPNRLRLQLIFDREAFELASIPWEFLYRPDNDYSSGYFLATDPQLVLSRYLPLDQDRASLGVEDESLRFLVVVSKPKELGPVLEFAVIEEIEKLCKAYNFGFDSLVNPPIDELIEKLESYKPHVLHFMGHGHYDRDRKQGQIALLQPDREKAEWVTDATFANYFDGVKPQLVVLHACEGASIDFTSKFAGLAPQLIRRQIPAVVAMQYEVTNKVAIRFSQIFYRQLADGKPIDGAVQEGRRQITIADPEAYSNRDFGTPVLYMRSRDGLIVPAIKPAEGQSEAPVR